MRLQKKWKSEYYGHNLFERLSEAPEKDLGVVQCIDDLILAAIGTPYHDFKDIFEPYLCCFVDIWLENLIFCLRSYLKQAIFSI
jgi:hypothetical protein